MVSSDLRFVDAYGVAGLGLLGDPTRRAIFELLARRPYTVGELAQQLPITRSAVSQHLRVLKDANLLTERRDGTRRLYRANTDTMAQLRAFLDDYWTSGLERLRDVAEAAEARKRQTKGRK